MKWLMGGHIEMQFVPGKLIRFATCKPHERLLQMEPNLIDDALASAQEIVGREIALVRPDFILLNRGSPDQETPVFPEGVPNINAPRPVWIIVLLISDCAVIRLQCTMAEAGRVACCGLK